MAVNVVDVAAAVTVTAVGTESRALVLEIVTAAPPVGAALVRVMVQVLEAFGPRLVGLQVREETSTGATRLIVAVADLLL